MQENLLLTSMCIKLCGEHSSICYSRIYFICNSPNVLIAFMPAPYRAQAYLTENWYSKLRDWLMYGSIAWKWPIYVIYEPITINSNVEQGELLWLIFTDKLCYSQCTSSGNVLVLLCVFATYHTWSCNVYVTVCVSVTWHTCSGNVCVIFVCFGYLTCM